MKSVMSFNPLDHNGRYCYIDDKNSIGAIMYEYGNYFNVLDSELFKKAFYPLDANYYQYSPINFEPRIISYLDIISAISPSSLEHHYFLAIFITYLDVSIPSSLYYKKEIYINCLEHTKYFTKGIISDELVEGWYEEFISKLIS